MKSIIGIDAVLFLSTISFKAVQILISVSFHFVQLDFKYLLYFQFQEKNLRFRSGKVVPIDQFYWDTNFPTQSHEKLVFRIRKDNRDSDEGFWNLPTSIKASGVICEI